MLDSIQELETMLTGFGYADKAVLELSVPEHDVQAFAIEIAGDESITLWSAFRQSLEQTRRWPLLHACWGGPATPWAGTVENEDIFMRFPFASEAQRERADTSPAAIVAASEHATIEPVIATHATMMAETMLDELDYSLEATAQRCGDAPALDDVTAQLSAGEIDGYVALERWLLDWEIQHAAATYALKSEYDGHRQWFEPEGQAHSLLLLPDMDGAAAPAFAHWYGAETVGTDVVIAALRGWNGRYGAELVAHYGTMLHLNVARPPSTIEAAFDLALEQQAIAPCTTALPGVSLRDHARSLIGAETWFLHERP